MCEDTQLVKLHSDIQRAKQEICSQNNHRIFNSAKIETFLQLKAVSKLILNWELSVTCESRAQPSQLEPNETGALSLVFSVCTLTKAKEAIDSL